MRCLHSLSCAKYKILLKSAGPGAPEGSPKTIAKTDVFSYNKAFTDKMRRIKVPLPPVDERRRTVEDVDKDRRYAIDATRIKGELGWTPKVEFEEGIRLTLEWLRESWGYSDDPTTGIMKASA